MLGCFPTDEANIWVFPLSVSSVCSCGMWTITSSRLHKKSKMIRSTVLAGHVIDPVFHTAESMYGFVNDLPIQTSRQNYDNIPK